MRVFMCVQGRACGKLDSNYACLALVCFVTGVRRSYSTWCGKCSCNASVSVKSLGVVMIPRMV